MDNYNKPFGQSFENRLSITIKHETDKANLNIALHLSQFYNRIERERKTKETLNLYYKNGILLYEGL